MSTGLIPERLRVRNFKLVMRGLLALWTVIACLGFGIYYYGYVASQTSAVVVTPLTHLLRQVDDIHIHAEELTTAAQRGNLTTAQRHAEHLVNLIAGKTSPDYGDVDRDGVVEDPGDGTGALVYLQRVRSEAERASRNRVQAVAAADQVGGAMMKIETGAQMVIRDADQSTASAQAGEILALAERINGGGDGSALISPSPMSSSSPCSTPGSIASASRSSVSGAIEQESGARKP